ncbi:MAG TPA: hypothetical protein VFU29_19400 [Chitinophagaceae bacterium]|nr:hypothetical protein [Chitinophagaceae bacterium]
MSKIKETIVEAILPTIKLVGKIQMTNVLSGIKEHNTPEIYKNTLLGIYANFSLLKEATSRSETKIDDGIVDLVLEAVFEKATADGIVLS